MTNFIKKLILLTYFLINSKLNMLSNLVLKRNFFTVVPQSHVYYREFLGLNRTRLKPGVHIFIPMCHKLHKIDIRTEDTDIKNISCYTSDSVPVILNGKLFYRVTDPELACFSIKNYRSGVVATGESSIRSVIGKFSYDEITKERNKINDELIRCIGNSVKIYGVETTSFEILDFGPSNPGVQKQLELQLENERKRRANELETLAKIRTAEGEKQSAVLKSEGELISIKNKADAERYYIETKTKAVIDQINTLKNTLDTNENVISYLLESKRIEEFGKLHSSPNKEIVFVDPKSIVPSLKLQGDYMNNKL